jgi:prolyl-tRNA editing enzyme YbaK/EbsC (Cys-tRNA(Pro) deacylase)
MSKSLTRVTQALTAAGLTVQISAMVQPTRTAAEAAAAAGVTLNQIVKSIILQGASGQLYLFLTAGGNQIDQGVATILTGEPLTQAEAGTIRRITGFAIGGVSPIGHLMPLPTWFDPDLLQFPQVWAAAGTPNHIFAIAPAELLALTRATQARFTQTA